MKTEDWIVERIDCDLRMDHAFSSSELDSERPFSHMDLLTEEALRVVKEIAAEARAKKLRESRPVNQR